MIVCFVVYSKEYNITSGIVEFIRANRLFEAMESVDTSYVSRKTLFVIHILRLRNTNTLS